VWNWIQGYDRAHIIECGVSRGGDFG
jgi:hypothetical protein